MTRFLVTGASGLLGLNFSLQAVGRHQIVGVVNQHTIKRVPFHVVQSDLGQPGVIEDLLDEYRPEVVIHCAAMANVDACETQPDLAYHINATVPGEMALACKSRGVRFVHISTDAVFDGQRGDYSEMDAPNPINVYSKTKLAGEQAVLGANPDAVVARVNFYGYSLFGKRSLGEFFVNNLKSGNSVMGFTDVHFCPLEVNDLVDVLLLMVEKELSGLYHVISPESLSKYEFGLRIAKTFKFDDRLIKPVPWAEAGLKATRSPNLTLQVDKLVRDLDRPIPDLRAGIARFYALYRNGYPQQVHSYAASGS